MAGTNVKAYGFEISLCTNMELGEFFHELVRNEDKPRSIGGVNIIPYADIKENYIIGAVVSLRDDKKSIASRRDSKNNLIITKDELGSDESTTEVSLFCINPISMKGLMYSYLTSVSIVGLYRLLRPIHDKLKLEKVKLKRDELSQHGKLKNKSKEAEEYHSGDFEITSIQSMSDIRGLLENFISINEMEFRVTEPLAPSPAFAPISPFVENSNLKLRISNKHLMNAIHHPIVSTVQMLKNQHNVKALKLVGKGLDGEYLGMLLGENKDEFEKLGYDRYVELLPTGNFWDYTQCPGIARLIGIAKNKAEVFGSMPKNTDWVRKSTADLKGW